MRDIQKYTESYNVPNFEEYQVAYRRKKVLEVVRTYQPKKILEIGCGMEPLFKYLETSDYEKYAVIEPSDAFYHNALQLSSNNEKILCIHEFFGGGMKNLILKKSRSSSAILT